MKYTIETESIAEARILLNATDLLYTLEEIDNTARNCIKHNESSAITTLQEIRQLVSDMRCLIE